MIKACIFDLDGVITNTAGLHATCWKRVFDEYLQTRANQTGEAFRPFDRQTDYALYVDGKPRFDGVRDFLRSRGISLPDGLPNDPPQTETINGIGNRKNDLVNDAIRDKGVEPYEGTVRLIRQLRRDGFKIAVVTSSANCTAVLKSAGLDAFFDVRASIDPSTIPSKMTSARPSPLAGSLPTAISGVSLSGRPSISGATRLPW